MRVWQARDVTVTDGLRLGRGFRQGPHQGRHQVRGACHHDCPDTCAWIATVENGQAIRLRGDPDHPLTAGELCPKVNRYLDRVYHPDRLLTPLRRVPGSAKGEAAFEPIGWGEAIGLVAGRLAESVDVYGPETVLPYSFAGTQGLVQMGMMADRFFDALGATRLYRHLCGVTAWLGAAEVHGLPDGMDPEDLRHSRTILLWGTNTLVTNRHLWPTVEAARADGATVVVVDPVRTTTAERADHHVQPRPGTDVALVLGMVHVLERDGHVDRDFLDGYATGADELLASAEPFDPAATEAATGVPAATVEWLATTFATRRPAAVRVLVGLEHRQHGQEAHRALAMLPAVTGAWRDVGGGLCRSTQQYFDRVLLDPVPRRLGAERPRAVNMASLGEVLAGTHRGVPLDPPITAMVVHNCNPATITPDQNAVLAGLVRDDLFTVVLEQFMTDTARYADVVLPATTQVEHLDLMNSWGHLYLSLNRPAIAPVGDALPNTEVFRRLAVAMGLDAPGLADDDETMVRQLLDSDHPWLDGIDLERLDAEGWVRLNVPVGYRPPLDGLVETPDGRLHLGALDPTPGDETPDGARRADPDRAARYPLGLMTRKQHARFLNSHYGGFADHHPRESSRGDRTASGPVLDVHPVDAAARGVADGDLVRVFNDRGSLELPAAVVDRVQPGLVAVPFGWWGRGVNALTNPAVGRAIGSAAFHDTLVQVERLAGGPGMPERREQENA